MEKFAIAVKAFIVKDHQLLVIKRRPNDVHKPGQWDIPGGRLSLGESPFEGLRRETKEEVGLKIEINHPLAIQHFTRDDGQVITMIIFVCHAITDTVKLSKEHTEYQWTEVTTAQEMLHEWLQQAVTAYQRLHKI